jgi:ATP-dependent Clp protease adapter protein ClpS
MPTTDQPCLPEKPDLACERKRAKTLLKALRSFDSDAIARFRSYHPRFADLTAETLRPANVQLSDAQWVIAREYGFASWPALKAHIEQICMQVATKQAAFSVVVLNDDATPMDFVVRLLQQVFEKSADEARQIMLDTHNHGFGVCGVYGRWEEAESKVAAAMNLAQEYRHPLRVTSTFGDAESGASSRIPSFSWMSGCRASGGRAKPRSHVAWRRTSAWQEPNGSDSTVM